MVEVKLLCFVWLSRFIKLVFFKPIHLPYLPAYEDGTECSETSVYELQTPGNYPEESIPHSEQGESLKSGKFRNWQENHAAS
jgi:hypothetical protein